LQRRPNKKEEAMGGAKNVAVAVLFLAVIIGAVVWTVKWHDAADRAKRPESYLKQQMKLIDSKTMEVMTKTREEWEGLGYKNPKTGNRMARVMPCPWCGKEVPLPGRKQPSPEELQRNPMAAPTYEKVTCPYCGKEVPPRF
jgi:endogenous inhibitor of DNA gyrase (YacG/DUF329 family)